MRMLKSSIVALIVALGLMVQGAAPAGAITIGGITAVVRIQTQNGLGYPGITPPNGGTFTITTTVACAAQVDNVNKVDKEPVDIAVFAPPAPGVGSCSITGTGTFAAPGANCGRSTGTVTGEVEVNGNIVEYTGTFQTGGSAVVITGTASKDAPWNQSGLFVFVGDATPDPAAGTSCTNKTQREFIVVGIANVVLT